MVYAPVKEIEYELDVNPARDSDNFDFIMEHGFNTHQPFSVEDDGAFMGDDADHEPPYFDQFRGEYHEVAERAVELNNVQLQSGFWYYQFSVRPIKEEE